MANFLNKNKILFYLSYLVAFITLIALFLLSKATEGSQKFEQFYQPLLIVTLVGIAFLFIIVVSYLLQTINHYRQKKPGASLSVTILIRTLLLSFIPLLFISFFAFKFLKYEFQSSFDKGINDALNNSLVLSKKALDVRALKALEDSYAIAKIIAPFEFFTLQTDLEKIRKQYDAFELTVFDEKGFIQSFATKNNQSIIPDIPEHSDFTRVDNENGVFIVESNQNSFQIRSLVSVKKLGAPNYYLQSLFYIPDTISELTTQVNKTISERDKFNYLMPKVNSSFIFVLLLVSLLASLLLILSSIGFASNMVQPIRDLLRGTKHVSEGDFSKPVISKRADDFGTLINSFNQMTQSLKTATEEAETNKNRVESERAYLATVIKHMTAAVVTLDYEYKLLTYNERAEQLLDCPLDEVVYLPLDTIHYTLENYKNFINQLNIGEHTDDISPELNIEIDQSGETKQFLARITPLPSTDELHGGYVIIFDEMGQYLQQQKQAAWEEVARRLAHEIKNPLTPILLAAERLNYKLSGHLEEKEQQVLTRSIDVISKQVKSLKNMVDDFSHYAKPINAKKSNVSINTLLKDIFDLYKGHFENITFSLVLDAKHDEIKGNTNLLRQVFHNLIKNAIEACEEKVSGNITIQTNNEDNVLTICIDDTGIGLPVDNGDDIFSPYITTKEKGTGLGLAIVKKIIVEHHGSIHLDNRYSDEEKQTIIGTRAAIYLPLQHESIAAEMNSE